jgi:2-methylcitrate dehydratase PrpD
MQQRTLTNWLRLLGPQGMGRPRRWTAAETEALGRELAEERRRIPFRHRMQRRKAPEFRRVFPRWLAVGISARTGRRR